MNPTQTLKPLPEYRLDEIYPHRRALSSTQFLKYEESPSEFYTEYVLEARGDGSVAMHIGRIWSALYADRTLDFRAHLAAVGAPPRIADLFERCIKQFPVIRGGSPEHPLRAKVRGWEFRATLDDFVEQYHTIVENKTGETVWNQERVNFSDQLTFQAWTHWKKYGVPPRKIILNWVDCRARATKHIHTFSTSRSVNALKQFEERVHVVLDNLEAENFTRNIYG